MEKTLNLNEYNENKMKEKLKLKEKIEKLIKEKKELSLFLNKKIKENNIKSQMELSFKFSGPFSSFKYIELVLPDLISNYNNFDTYYDDLNDTYNSIKITLSEQQKKNYYKK